MQTQDHNADFQSWSLLDRDQAHAVLNTIRSKGEGALFTPVTSEIKVSSLPFYKNFRLYRMTNYASLPIFTMDFLSDGDTFYHLNGSPAPVMAANTQAPVILSLQTVIPYARFYCRYVVSEDGDVEIVDDLEALPFFDSIEEDEQARIKRHHNTGAPVHDERSDTYTFRATLVDAGSLTRADVVISSEGEVSFREERMLLHDTLTS